MSSKLWQTIEQDIGSHTGEAFKIERQRGIGGGSINQTALVEGSGQQYFIKLNQTEGLDMFIAEAEGLRELAGSKTLRIPNPICHGVNGSQAYLVMEYLQLGGGNQRAEEKLGEQLAEMHHCVTERFGWTRNNTIGSTPQENAWEADWVDFWRRRRLGVQLSLAARNGYRGILQREGERLMENLAVFFTDYQPRPSLLHGDLWSGNYAFSRDGEPVIFDPAVYYGDREADIAMTELFGGFSSRFYQAYQATWPLDAGYKTRKNFYNLYHILNHANLFGGGYAGQAQRMIQHLLSEFKA